MIDVIAFDADDTLWHNETLYTLAQEKFKQLLSPYCSMDGIEEELFQTEMRNLRYFGYGIKPFTLSMIETAIEITGGRIQGGEIGKIIGFAREMLESPVELLDGAEEVIRRLSESHPLMIITKGDLFDQESKLARSGLADYFGHIEVVSHKTPDTYRTLLARHDIDSGRFLMVGNSLKSDIMPVIAVGGQAVYIPYQMTWAHEKVLDAHEELKGYFELDHIRLLPALIEQLRDR